MAPDPAIAWRECHSRASHRGGDETSLTSAEVLRAARRLRSGKVVRIASPRCLSLEDAVVFAQQHRRHGRTLVFTNGVFDLLHPGHIRYLTEARLLGDALVVGVNSDRSVRANKGPERPINSAEERAELLLALRAVDAVVVFDQDTPRELIATLKPDVLVKGADWGPHDIVGRESVESGGGRVVRLELTQGFSTTSLIRRAHRSGPTWEPPFPR